MKTTMFLLFSLMLLSFPGFAQSQDNQAALISAIANNDSSMVSTLLSGSPELVNIKNQAGEPVLVTAVKEKKTAIARMLIERGADVNMTNATRQTPLLLAAYYGDYDLCKLLLEKGAAPDVPSIRGRKPIEYAAANRNIDLFNLFMAAGERIDAPLADGTTLLHWAANGGDTTLFAYILSYGLDINAVDNEHASLMHWAASGGDTIMLAYLIQKGLSILTPANGGWLPVQSAIQYNQVDAFRFFLNHGISLNVKFEQGNTIMHLVAETGSIDIMKQLLEKNPDVNVRNDFDNTPLLMSTMNRSADMSALLIEHGAEINPSPCIPNDSVTCDRFTTPLHVAVFWNMDATRLLVEKGAKINVKNGTGNMPLHFAVRGDSLNIVRFLLENGADCNARNNDGTTPLFNAIQNGNSDMVNLLLQYGADPNVADNKKCTPLHLASINGYSEIAKTLIAKGANINMKDNDNMTPMDYAIYYGNQSTIAVLKDNGARLAKAETFNNLLSEKLGDAEAVVYYLNYSAWAVKTSNHLLIIDFFPQQKDPDESGVLNGRINPAELAGMNVTVVASHQHGDHYNEVIWEWEKSIPNIQYILGFTAPQHAANRIYIEPHTSQEVNGINVTPVTSNDAGEGFMIEVDGITLVHPGDLASSTRDISADYRAEIDFLTGLNKPIDFLFLPVTGCSFPDVEAVKLGDLYAISKLNPRVVFPMHGDAASFIEFKGRVMEQDKNQQVEVAINRGDRFFFKNEKIQKVEL